MFGLHNSCSLVTQEDYYTLEDYTNNMPRWCVGCGDFSILTAVQRLCRDEQLPPEKTVFVSGIGCSSRFPHYIRGYGFHGLHGRAMPIAEGIAMYRPDLHVFVNTGDGDCCSIGAAHWLHAVRYNMNMVVMLHDNYVYALTKNQTSPTSRQGMATNTQPKGSYLAPINPLSVTLGITNVSFVAQAVEWLPELVYSVIKEGYHHKGFSFIRILQRCPAYLPKLFEQEMTHPDRLLLLKHSAGVQLSDNMMKFLPTQADHDPSNLLKAQEFAAQTEKIPVGILYRNESVPLYEKLRKPDRIYTTKLKQEALECEFDKFAI